MIFEKKYVSELFNLIEKTHNKEFWRVFLEQVDKSQILGSGASEYEIYFNFLLTYHPLDIKIRSLKWYNIETLSKIKSFSKIPSFSNKEEFDYVSWHWYLR